jgi:hypothetical protein
MWVYPVLDMDLDMGVIDFGGGGYTGANLFVLLL